MAENYVDYFRIDPEYFPVVDEDVINNNPDLWKKYYPHETFVKLVEITEQALSRKIKRSIWVEGAYGTGKSHAVLTLKKLLDASEEETREYFDKYPTQLSKDSFNRFQGAKNGGKIITVHRYGSSFIKNDNDLATTIQESVIKALNEAGIENKGSLALKERLVDWLSDEDNKNYFNSKIEKGYKDYLNGDKVDDLIDKLKTYSDQALTSIVEKITKVAEECGINALLMGIDGVVDWIEDVINANNLKAIIFIWDEFTEYFLNNVKSLTGFQRIAQISASYPFYLMIVTHTSSGLFDDVDDDKKKIFDRFETPIRIELPENMAFTLMGKAMEKNTDPVIVQEWAEYVNDLYDRTHESRELIKKRVGINDMELQGILPIHPYSALLLKYMATAFASNQRSMFDFIKSDTNESEKGFQWFMRNHGPLDEDPLLTIDLLWDFFYTKKDNLDSEIRSILDCYSISKTRKLDADQDKVLKAILLLQAISQNVGNAVELFIPNAMNLNNAFEGSDLENGGAEKCAEQLVREEVLFKKNIGNNRFQYSVFVSTGDKDAIDRIKEQIKENSTTKLVEDGLINEAISIRPSLKWRFDLNYASIRDFDQKIKKLKNEMPYSKKGKIVTILTFAKDENESNLLQKKIFEAAKSGEYDMVFIDTSLNALGKKDYDSYIDNLANAMYQKGKDNQQALQYEINSKEVLRRWKNRISNGELIVSYKNDADGKRILSSDELYEALLLIDKDYYPECLEGNYTVSDNLWGQNQTKKGVEYGAKQETVSVYSSSNPKLKLETALAGAWGVDNYWETTPWIHISKTKKAVKDLIDRSFQTNGRIAISEIYDLLKNEPYGFMPCSMSAFILGFLLKEYVDGSYNCSDNTTSVPLNVEKLSEIVEEIIKQQITPSKKYLEKYIVSMTEKERAFNKNTALVFDVSESSCTTIENTRNIVRNQMKTYSFPIWCLKKLLATESLKTNEQIVSEAIDLYCGIANDENYAGKKTATDLANDLGVVFIDNPSVADDLKALFNKEKCTQGMIKYLEDYRDCELPSLANEIGDNGAYIDKVKARFDADAANWVWNEQTAQSRIDNVILDYKIIRESNKYLPKTTDINATLSEWCDKCKNIKVSYPAAKPHLEELTTIFEMLYNIKRYGMMPHNRQDFYDTLCSFGKAFESLYANQLDLFKKVCSIYIEDLDDEDITKIMLQSVPKDVFTLDKTLYLQKIDAAVREYKENLINVQLKKLWFDKTKTDNPKAWSKLYRMPIQCMVDNNEIDTALSAFDAINRNKSSENEINKAITYINNATFINTLSNEDERNAAFSKNVLKNYAVVLTDIEEVKDYLTNKVGNDPYLWYGHPRVEEAVQKLAQKNYIRTGCDKALERIDAMDVNMVKAYLKELIKDNMNVGIEIIKED